MAPGFLTNEDVADNQGAALLDGSFDWEKYWTPLAQMLDDWQQKGYFNKDILTASDDASIQALANGDGAIVISGNHTITQALSYNPDARLGIMAIPSPNEGGKVYVSSGEGACYGIWKDTEYPEESRKLLEYLARDDVDVYKRQCYGRSIIRRQHPCILLEYFRKVPHTCITHGFSRLLDRNIGIAAYQFFRIFYADFRHEVNIFLSRLFVEQLAEIGGGRCV